MQLVLKNTPATLTRALLTQQIHRHIGFSRRLCHHLASDCFLLMTEALLNREAVKIHGFGTFTMYHKAPRKGRAISTGEIIHIPARRMVKFNPSPQLRQSLKNIS